MNETEELIADLRARLAHIDALCAYAEMNPVGWGAGAASLARSIREVIG